MRIFIALILVALSACRQTPREQEEVRSWLRVLELKKQQIARPEGESKALRQQYADALRDFIRRYPDHRRARDAYAEIERDFARALVRRGRYDEAANYYRRILLRDPSRESLRNELADVLTRRHVTAYKLKQLHRGMSREDVIAVLGYPVADWTRDEHPVGRDTESWYYRRPDGKVAGVFFENGRLFAADYDSPVALPAR